MKTITLKVYRKSKIYSSYLSARFGDRDNDISFEWNGHRWAYKYTSFDDKGEYNLLYRFVDDAFAETKQETLSCRYEAILKVDLSGTDLTLLKGRRIHGEIFGDNKKRFSDGSLVLTSPLQSIELEGEDILLLTENTTYKLVSNHC